jgi:glycosyltransferase involved in cell wall biosynthesis
VPSGAHVIHLCDYGSAYPGTFIPMLSALAEAVGRQAWSFEAVFAPAAEDREWYAAMRRDGTRARVFPPLARRSRPRWVASLLAEQAAPTILHTHFARWDLPAVLAARNPRNARPVAVLWHRHGILSRRLPQLARDLARFGLAGRAVDAHLCVGPGTHGQVLARGAPRRRTMLFPNPVDVPRFPMLGAEERVEARKELGVDQDEAVLVAFTWEWKRKGGPLVLALVRELVERGHSVTALLVGGGEPARAGAQRLGLERHVRELPPRPDPRTYFAAADVFLAPSRAEAFGFAPHESVCCGTPVIASDVSGHRHYGVHLPAMRLTPLEPRAMADAVEQELGASERDRIERILVSRDYLERNASVGAWVDRLLHIYTDALAGRASATSRS